ncbi:type II toxin-antitoxin system death-on-curing family toxin [Halobacillus locisalis]|uniref:Type II toxin-antitoxin system death-on-curing family toxin n=1 Tax=Halobacillus locisalis TaxID=220753 RepID=A0A838CY22_9BACI|nr:type II toxin-antitoxin system death-on-curing family toxin [Halobacillus locisalis]MBA2176850.1 type II toxin-antitoxin system death-on-curing family toxin [Halobacillus locisalis]
MIYLTGEEIEFLHYTIMEYYNDSDQAGIRSIEAFESMLERPKTELFGEEQFPTVLHKACCYFHSISRSGHIFHNGNKRTALTVLETYLNMNGYELTFSNKQAEDFTVYVAEDDKFKTNDCIDFLLEELYEFVQPMGEEL